MRAELYFILITQNIDLTQIPICNFWKNGV